LGAFYFIVFISGQKIIPVDLCRGFKTEKNAGTEQFLLKGKEIALIFEKD